MTGPVDLEGAAAPPRSNGELVFAEPWESRAFAMAVALNQANAFTWRQFQAALIARIARWEAAPDQGARWSYYHHWLAALEDVLGDLGVVLTDDVTSRAVGLAQRGSGHDHALT
jgi:nitrile hydratase accessory protein